MKKPLLEDYSLTEDDLEWAVTREKEIDNLSYKKFLPKILVCIVVVGTILFTFVFPSVFLSPKCSQTLSCHIGDTLLHMLKLAAFMCIPGFWVSLPLAMISKWIYKSSAKNDERLQRVWRYNALLNQYNNISDKDKVSDKVINEKENIISEKEIKKDGDMFLFEEKPFTGTSIGFRTDADEKKSKVEGSKKETNFKFTTYKN